MQKIVFEAGEQRHVRLLIHSTNGEPFKIRTARYELLLLGEVQESGECIVEEHVIDCFISPARRHRTYELKVAYEVADEVLVETIKISVM